MKQLKLWAGIAGIIAAGYFLIISFYEASWNYLTSSGHINGALGIVIASLLLAGSIVRIAMRRFDDDSGSIISLVLFGVAAAVGIAATPIYHYLQNWAILCAVMAVLSIVMIIVKNKG